MNTEETIAAIKRLRLEGGDVVIVRCEDRISKDAAEQIRHMVAGTLQQAGHSVPVMVLDKGLSIELLGGAKLRKMDLRDLAGDDPGPPPDFLYRLP